MSGLAAVRAWEEYVSTFLEVDEAEQGCLWSKGDIALEVDTVYGDGSLERFAGDVGVTVQHVRRLRQTSKTFTNEHRCSFLSWRHHHIASQTDDPHGWIQKAHDNNWSTRDLEAAIKGDDDKPDWERMTERGDKLFESYKRFMAEWTSWGIKGREQQYLLGLAECFRGASVFVIKHEGRRWQEWEGV